MGWLGEPEKPATTAGPRPSSERGCTDVLCLIAFVAFWLGMLAIMAVSVATGDINAIAYGADYKGNRCGHGNYTNQTKTFYPRMDLDIFEQRAFVAEGKPWLVRLYGLCTEECIPEYRVPISKDGLIKPVNRANYHWVDGVSTIRDDRAENWVSVLPEISILNRCLPYSNEDSKEKVYCYFPTCTALGITCANVAGDPDSWLISNHPKFADKCQVSKTVSSSNAFTNYHQSTLQSYVTGQLGNFFGFMESIRESRVEIFVCSLVISVAISLLWLLSMRYAARIVIYFMIAAMFITLLGLTAVTFAVSCFIEDPRVYDCEAARLDTFSYNGVTLENLTVTRVAFFFCLLCFVLFTATITFLRKAIQTCVAIVRESSVVVGEMPTVFALPMGASVFAVGIILYFTYIGAYIATSSETTYAYFDANDPTAITDAIAADNQRVLYFMASYHLLGTLWALSFIIGFVTLTLAGAVSSWFFFRTDKELYPTSPLLSSIYTTARFHLGTVAFGSLLIAICQLLRIALEYLDTHTRSLQDSNVFAKLVLKCVKCFMWCLEKFLKFITGYAYIYTAIEGMSFLTAAKSTFVLIMKYPAQVYINHLVQMVLKMLMSITIPLLCGTICYFWVDATKKPDAMYCAMVTVIITFFIARLFAVVFEVIIESIFVCSFRDRDLYSARHTPSSIRVAFGFEAAVPQETAPLVKKKSEPAPAKVTTRKPSSSSTRAPAAVAEKA